MRPNDRRATLAGLFASAALPATSGVAATPASSQTPRPTRSVELTFLKSNEADPAALVRFIIAK